MTVRRSGPEMIELSGHCPIEDAEPLLGLLMSAAGQTVDWRACDGMHAAVAQVLMAAGPRMLGPPRGGFLKTMVALSLDKVRKAAL